MRTDSGHKPTEGTIDPETTHTDNEKTQHGDKLGSSNFDSCSREGFNPHRPLGGVRAKCFNAQKDIMSKSKHNRAR